MSREDRKKWNSRYSSRENRMGKGPRPWLEEIGDLLPESGRALDLAAGEGQNAVFLASRGLEVTAVDVSEVGLARAAERARRAGVDIDTKIVDLEKHPDFIRPESWDVITCFRYMQRNLAPGMEAGLTEGGLVVVEVLTRKTLERISHLAEEFLAAEGELADWFGGLETLVFEQCWEDDKHVSRIAARK